ncbi:hypothetical protein ACFL43_00525 [Thermodesulfobacteriota bacterium]
MNFIMRHISEIIIIVALFCIVMGVVLGEHMTLLTYAVVVCLSCIGIG